MEKFKPNNLEPSEASIQENIESEGRRVGEEFDNLKNNVEEIGSLNLPKEQEEKVMRKVLTKLEIIQVAIVGLGTGFGFTLAIQEAMKDPSVSKVSIAVTVAAGAWLANFRSAVSSQKG